MVLDLQRLFFFFKELCVFTVCVPFHPKNPSNAEYPAQNTVGVLLKRTRLAEWATHLVRFKSKPMKRFSPSSPPTPAPGTSRLQGSGGSRRWELLKSDPGWFWMQPSLEEQSSQAPDPPLHQGSLWTPACQPQTAGGAIKKKKVLVVPNSVYSKYFRGHFFI